VTCILYKDLASIEQDITSCHTVIVYTLHDKLITNQQAAAASLAKPGPFYTEHLPIRDYKCPLALIISNR